MHNRLRHAIDDVPASGWAHQARNADALAALDQNLSERHRGNQCAKEFGVANQRRCKIHRRRTVRPDPHSVRGFPFQFAHIKMIVAGRAAPIDARGRFARNEAAILPEVFAWAGAAATVQAVDDRGRNAPCFQHQPRHRGGERSACADCTTNCCDIWMCAFGFGRHPAIRSVPSGVRSRLRCFRPRRAP